MYVRKQGLSSEQQHEVAGRFFSQESQLSLVSYDHVCQQRISQIVKKHNDDPKLKVQALAAASEAYFTNEILIRGRTELGHQRIQLLRAVTVAASLSCELSRPPQVPQQQVPPSLAVPPTAILRVMLPAELNVPGTIRFPTGQAFTSGPSWPAQPVQHQRLALCYGQGTSLDTQPLDPARAAAQGPSPRSGLAWPRACMRLPWHRLL
jgi:hypothetical protein